MKLDTVRKLLTLVSMAGICLVFLANLPPFQAHYKEMFLLAGCMLLGNLALGFALWRCPHCKRLLNYRLSAQRICYHCGGRLDGDDEK